jgi:AmmeMemoRadiSam system protein A
MTVVFGGICPHPPIMVPEVGKEGAAEVKSSQTAMLELGKRIVDSGADVLVIISPHAPLFRDFIALNVSPRLKGNLGQFGAAGVSFDLDNDLAMVKEIVFQSALLKIPVFEMDEEFARKYHVNLNLDHGMTVPLYFVIKAGVRLPLVAASMGLLPEEQLYAFGAAVSRSASRLGKRVAVLASGDLSHRLTRKAPAGFDPKGKEFDLKMVELISKAQFEEILHIDKDLAEKAGECGLRSIQMMSGSLDGLSAKGEVLSYEGPFGVGYMVAVITPGEPKPGSGILDKLLVQNKEPGEESFLVSVARKTLENYYKTGKLEIPEDKDIPPQFSGKAGVFVSLKIHGNLRGCIGTLTGQYKNVVAEVAHNVISAATRDPRFYPVVKEELADLSYSVDVLGPPEAVNSLEELNSKNYGVIVRSGRRSGLLLPDLEEVDTVEEQVSIARQKAGIGPDEPIQLERFRVERYK